MNELYQDDSQQDKKANETILLEEKKMDVSSETVSDTNMRKKNNLLEHWAVYPHDFEYNQIDPDTETADVFEYVFHIADMHILSRNHAHIEFAWRRLTEQICSISNYVKKVVLVIAGDIFDNKLHLKASDIQLFHNLLTMLEDLHITTIILCGNHDFNSNRSSMEGDKITSNKMQRKQNENHADVLFSNNNYHEDKILALMETEKYKYIFYYPKSCVVRHKNIAFHVYSPIDHNFACNAQKTTKTENNKCCFELAVVHGLVVESTSAISDALSPKFSINDFPSFFDAVLLGGVHLAQRLNVNMAYPGSFVQKTRMESHIKGCILWHLTKHCTPEFISLQQLSVYLQINVQNNQVPVMPLPSKRDVVPIMARGVQLYYVKCSNDFIQSYQKTLLNHYPEITKLDGIFCRNSIVTSWTKKGRQKLSIEGEKDDHFLLGENQNKIKNLDGPVTKSQIDLLLEAKLKESKQVTAAQRARIMAIHQELFLVVSKNVTVTNNKDWQLRWISWKGIGCYGEDENYFCFDDLVNLNSIVGKNKIGKSTLLEIITICLFNRCINNGSKAAYLNTQCKQHYIKCCISVGETDTYKIEHCWIGQKECVAIYKNDVKIEHLVTATTTETNQYIENNIVGPYIIFENTVIASQERKSLVKMNAQQRYDFISQIVELDKLKEAEKANITEMNILAKKQKTMSMEAHYAEVSRLRECYVSKQNVYNTKKRLVSDADELLKTLEERKNQLFLTVYGSSSAALSIHPNEIAAAMLAISHKHQLHPSDTQTDDEEKKEPLGQCPKWDEAWENALSVALDNLALQQAKREELGVQISVYKQQVQEFCPVTKICPEDELAQMIQYTSSLNPANVQTQYEKCVEKNSFLTNRMTLMEQECAKLNEQVQFLQTQITAEQANVQMVEKLLVEIETKPGVTSRNAETDALQNLFPFVCFTDSSPQLFPKSQNQEYMLQLQGRCLEHTQFVSRFQNAFQKQLHKQSIQSFLENEQTYANLLTCKIAEVANAIRNKEYDINEWKQSHAAALVKKEKAAQQLSLYISELECTKTRLKTLTEVDMLDTQKAFQQNSEQFTEVKGQLAQINMLNALVAQQDCKSRYDALKKKIVEQEQDLAVCDTKIKEITENVQAHQTQKLAHKDYKELEQKLKQTVFLNKAKTELEEITTEYTFIKSLQSKDIDTTNKLETELAILKIDIQRAEEETMIGEKECEQLMDRQLYHKLINHKDGIAQERMVQLCTDIQLRCNAIFTEVTDFTIELVFFKKIDLYIVNNTTKVRVHGEHACGYERFIVDVVLRQVICSLVTSGIPRVLFLDEGFGSADEDNLDILCRNVLPILAHEFEKVVVISHVPKVHEYTMMNCDISVDPKTGQSKLQFGKHMPTDAHIITLLQATRTHEKKSRKLDQKEQEDGSIIAFKDDNNATTMTKSKYFECLACNCRVVNVSTHRNSLKHKNNLVLFSQTKKKKLEDF